MIYDCGVILPLGRAHQSESMQVSESSHTLPRLRPRPEALSQSEILLFCQAIKLQRLLGEKASPVLAS
jgi:hypothetical protein